MSVSGKLLALRRKIAEQGVAGALGIALRALWQSAFDRDEILFSLALPSYRRPPGLDAAGARVRRIAAAGELSRDDDDALRAYGGADYVASFHDRLARGWVLFLVDLGGRPAGGGWVLGSGAGIPSRVVPILPGDVTIIDCFTFPECRGRGAYPALLAAIAEYARDAGGLRAFIFTRRHNDASLRGIAKAGFAPVLVYQTLAFGRSELVRWKRAVRDGDLPRERRD